MTALTQTYTLHKPTGVMSRHRSLRGKSVSETRKVVESILGGDVSADKGTGSPIRSAFGSRYRKRAKTIDTGDMPLVPPPLPSATEMNISPSYSVASMQPLCDGEPSTPSKTFRSPLKKSSVMDLDAASRLSESETLGDIHDQFPAVPTPTEMPVATALTADTAVETASIKGDVPTKPRQTQEQKLLQEIEKQRLREEEAALHADEVTRLKAETEQKHKDIERLHSPLRDGSSHGSDTSSLPSSPVQPKPRSSLLEKFWFRRGRRSNAATLSPSSSTCASVAGDFSRATSLEPQLMPRTFLEPEATAFAFPFRPDSPLPNGHGADRSVQVRCRGVRHDINVTPDTNTADILFSCADGMAHPFNTCTSVVVESYTSLGLERRLRRYERIKDVLNSWDRDTQHHLLIDPSFDSFDNHQDLEMSSVPGGDGSGFVLQMHHSQRPGKWSKRFITLLGNGQLFSCKKADSVLISQHQVGGGSASPALTAAAAISMGATMLCHLVSYDIYTPTETQAKKQLKPPKRFCYAVKSQQKATEADATLENNFVHFFATDDPDVARRFHAAIHAWRSWYIVNGRGNKTRQGLVSASRSQHPGRDDSLAVNPIPHPLPDQQMKLQQRPTTATGAPQITAVRHKPKKSISHVKVAGGRHRLRVSIDEAPYTIGEFQPLLDLGRFEKPIDEFGKDWELRESAMPAGADGVAGVVQATEARVEDEFASGHKKVAKGCVSSEAKTVVDKINDTVRRSPQPRSPRVPAETPPSPDMADLPTSPPVQSLPESEDMPDLPSPATVQSLPKSQTKSWFPSASQHTATQRAKSVSEAQARAAASRPSTSAGEKTSSTSMSGGRHHRPPMPHSPHSGLGNGSQRFHDMPPRHAPTGRRPDTSGGGSRPPTGDGSGGGRAQGSSSSRPRRPPMPHSPHSGLGNGGQRFLDVPPRHAPAGRRADTSGSSRSPTSDGSSGGGRAQGSLSSRGRSNTVGNVGRPPVQPPPPVPSLRGKSTARTQGPGVEQWARGVASAEREKGVAHGAMKRRTGSLDGLVQPWMKMGWLDDLESRVGS